MSYSLKSELGKKASTQDGLSVTEAHDLPPETIRATFRYEQNGIRQLTEDMRKSVENVAEMLIHTAAEETRARFLAEASVRLFASTDEDATFVTLAHLLVPTLADGVCIFSLGDDDAQCRASAHADPEKERYIPRFARHLGGSAGKRPDWVEQVLRGGQGNELSGQTIRSALSLSPADRELTEAVAALEMQWLEGWPLFAENRRIGAMFLFGGTLRHAWDVGGAEMLQSLAHCASLAVCNAQQHEHSRRTIRAREHLLAVSAHDLRNSLSLALMSLSTLEVTNEPSNGPVVLSRMALMRKGMGRMQRLIDDLLDSSCIETGRLSIAPSHQSAGVLIDETIETFRDAAHQKGVGLVGSTPTAACFIDCDGYRLLQVLSNLVGNALKFTPRGGSIRLTLVDCGSEVEFFVADTGCGIPPAELPNIFESYRRTNRSRYGGVGLGLSIAKGIIESHGGKIWVESRMGEGTTVFFRVPKEMKSP